MAFLAPLIRGGLEAAPEIEAGAEALPGVVEEAPRSAGDVEQAAQNPGGIMNKIKGLAGGGIKGLGVSELMQMAMGGGAANGNQMSVAPTGVVGRTADTGMYGEEEVGAATKNRGDNSTPEQQSSSGADTKERGDGPEQLKDVDGGQDLGLKSPSQADGLGNQHGGDNDLASTAVNAFHSNMPLILEFAFSEDSGKDHPILQALDSLLEQAFPNYKDEQNEAPEEESDESDSEDMDDTDKEVKDEISKEASSDGYGNSPYRTKQWECPQCGNWDYEYKGNRGGLDWHNCQQCGYKEQSPTDFNRRQAPEGWDEQDQGVYDYDDWEPVPRMGSRVAIQAGYCPDDWGNLDPSGTCMGCGKHYAADYPGGEITHLPGYHNPQVSQTGYCPECFGYVENGVCQSCGKPQQMKHDWNEHLNNPTMGPGEPGPEEHLTPDPNIRQHQEYAASTRTAAFIVLEEYDRGTDILGQYGSHEEARQAILEYTQKEYGGATDYGDEFELPDGSVRWTMKQGKSRTADVPAALAQGAQSPDMMAPGAAMTGVAACPQCGQHHTAGTPCPTPGGQQNAADAMSPLMGGQAVQNTLTPLKPQTVITRVRTIAADPHAADVMEHYSDPDDDIEENQASPPEGGEYEDWDSEDDQDRHPWVDDSGQALEPGQEYEMHSTGYAIPDKIKVIEVTPNKLTYELEAGDIAYKDTITVDDVHNQGYTFKPSTGNPDEEPGFGMETGKHKPLELEHPIRPGQDAAPQVDDMSVPPTKMGGLNDTHECMTCGWSFGVKPKDWGKPQVCPACGSSKVLADDDDSADVQGEPPPPRMGRAEDDDEDAKCDCGGTFVFDRDDSSTNCDRCGKEIPSSEEKEAHFEYTGSFQGDAPNSRDWLSAGSAVDVDPHTMAKIAGKDYSVSEQRAFIDETGEARNLHRLDLAGSHYEWDDDTLDSMW